MQIVVRPPYPDWSHNRMFTSENRFAESWMEPYLALRAAAAERSWKIDTWDIAPLESADVVLFYDLPATRTELLQAKAKAPRAPFILQILETPLNRPHAWVPENTEVFDAVFSYDPHVAGRERYHPYCLPIGRPRIKIDDPPFAQRKPALMMSTNRHVGFWATRGSGLSGLPVVGPMIGRWKVPLSVLSSQNRGELYTRRRHIVVRAQKQFPGMVDVYGAGWRGENTSWAHRIRKARPFSSARGPYVGDKFTLLPQYRFVFAFENMRGDVGYISEKLPDALLAGTVPIYLGDDAISDIFPPSCFIDARQFKSDHQLLEFIANCTEEEWNHYRHAGKQATLSPTFQRFEPHAYVQNILLTIAALTQSTDGRPHFSGARQ